MNNQDTQNAREYFTPDEQDAIIEEITKPVGEDRPIAQVDTGIEPGGRKKHVWYQSTQFQYGVILSGCILIGWVGNAIINGGKQPQVVASSEQQQIAALKKRLAKAEANKANQTRENSALTQGAQFDAIPLDGQNDKATPVSNTPTTPAKPTTPHPPSAQSQQRPIASRNTVRVTPTRRYAPPPRVTRPVYRPTRPNYQAQPKLKLKAEPKITLANCVEFVQGGVDVPACAKHRIKIRKTPQSQPVTFNPAPKPIQQRPIKPIQLTPYKPPTQTAYVPKSKPVKPSYEVNYLAGEIQTVDQYEQEFYGSGQTKSVPQLGRMMAKVIDHVEWLSPEDAQQLIIPLQITSGPNKGQTAEAKITKINGLQFTAHVVSLNGREIEPGRLELRRKNTKYLRAEMKRQGGVSFGKRLLGTVAAIGGEVASDQLANVRGGNHISGLIPRSGQSRQQITQYWRFDGEVEIVPIS